MGVRINPWRIQSSSHFQCSPISRSVHPLRRAVRDVMALMESWYPTATAQSWDRVRLIGGRRTRPCVRSSITPLPSPTRPWLVALRR